jgi:hypothetical protein
MGSSCVIRRIGVRPVLACHGALCPQHQLPRTHRVAAHVEQRSQVRERLVVRRVEIQRLAVAVARIRMPPARIGNQAEQVEGVGLRRLQAGDLVGDALGKAGTGSGMVPRGATGTPLGCCAPTGRRTVSAANVGKLEVAAGRSASGRLNGIAARTGASPADARWKANASGMRADVIACRIISPVSAGPTKIMPPSASCASSRWMARSCASRWK